MARYARLLLRFYGTFCIPSLIVSLLIVLTSMRHGVTAIVLAFWVKTFTLVVTLAFVYYSVSRELYYYKNLGIGKRKLFAVVFVLDMVLFVVITALAVLCG